MIIINVGKNENLTSLSSAANMDLYYGNEKIDSQEYHKYSNRILWNLGSNLQELKISNGHFMGSILAPNAVFDTGFNVDGNIVAKEVTIGGENHRWDWMMPAYPVVPNSQPEPKPTPNSDPEQPNFFPPASKDSDEPETPQFGEPQAKTHLPDAGTVSQAPATNNNEEVFFQPQAKRHFGKAVLTDKKTKTVKKAKSCYFTCLVLGAASIMIGFLGQAKKE